MPNDITYFSDANMLFGENQSDLLLTNFDAINNEIVHVLAVSPGERRFEPFFGSDIPKLLFRPVTPATAFLLEGAMFASVERWVERVSINRSESRVTAIPDAGVYDTYLVYTVSLETENRYLHLKLQQRR